jgi:mRNA interferase MazF
MEYRRGDVVLISFPYIQDFTRSKARPALVIQNDVGNAFSDNLILASISSQMPDKEYPVHYRVYAGSKIAKGAGLDSDCVVKAETIITIPKARVIDKLGRFPLEAVAAIDQCLKISLDLE